MLDSNRRKTVHRYRRFLMTCLMATAALAGVSSTASAQNARQTDLSAGYLNVNGSMHGVNIQVSSQRTRRWGLVGEFDWSSGTDCAGCEPAYNDIAALGGVRFGWQPTPKVSPFWQVLAGGLHSTAEDYYADYCCGLGRRLEQGFTVGYFAVQPGGGVTAMVTPRFGIRTQFDVQFAIPDQSQWEGFSLFPRFVAGGVIRLGGGK